MKASDFNWRSVIAIISGSTKQSKKASEARQQKKVKVQKQQVQPQQLLFEAPQLLQEHHQQLVQQSVTVLIEDETKPYHQLENTIVQREVKRSIFLAGTYHPANPKFAAVVKYDLNKLTEDKIPEFECLSRFDPGVKLNKHHNRIVWKICVLNSIINNNNTTLCLLPEYLCKTKNGSDAADSEEDPPLAAYIYDMKTATIIRKFKAPEASKFSGLVFCLQDMIYCITYPSWTNIKPGPCFQRYDLEKETTSDLEPFPWDEDYNEKILGYAVFKNFVLFSVDPTGLWAYFLQGNKWYEVSFDNQPLFQGVGVVIEENTLYALKESQDDSILLGLSVKMEEKNGDVVEFTASLEQEYSLPDRYCSRYKTREWDKDVLIHLGENNFCLVRNGLLGKGYDLQLLQLVMFNVQDQEVSVSAMLEHRVEICGYSPFEPILGFSLPASHSKQFKDKQQDSLGSNITLDPSEEIQEAVQ